MGINQSVDIEVKTKTKILSKVLISLVIAGGLVSLAALYLVKKGSHDYEILVKSFYNVSTYKSVAMKFDFTAKPEKKESATPVLDLSGIVGAQELKSGYDEINSELPADFLVNLYMQVNSDSLQSKSVKETNNYIKIGGNVNFGGTKFSGDAEAVKLLDDIYLKINEMPMIDNRMDFGAIKDKWIYLPPEELNMQSEYFAKLYEDSDENISDYYTIFGGALDTKFFVIKKSLPKVKVSGILLNHYVITFDFTKYPAFLKKIEKQLAEKSITADSYEAVKSMADPKYKKLVDMISKMQLFEVFIDAKTNTIRKMAYTAKLAFPNSIKKYQGKQIRATFTLNMDKINEKIVITKPKNPISLDEATALITGKPMDEILYSRQIGNIEKIRNAISYYSECNKQGSPLVLDDVLKKQASTAVSPVAEQEPAATINGDIIAYSRFSIMDPCGMTGTLKSIPKDIYSNQSYEYEKAGDDYELRYEIKNKPMPNINNWYELYDNVIEGINIADSTTVSREGKLMVDTDHDGLTDQMEMDIYLTDPNKRDSDGDLYFDGEEVKNGYNPLGPGKMDGSADALQL